MEDPILIPRDWNNPTSIIKVLGVGGGGCNAVSHMYNQGITGCTFIVCNTDRQVLEQSPVPCRIQLGEGLGAGTDPRRGREAAIGSIDKIREIIVDGSTRMLFITAGMGGGTGTGATPVIAKMAHDAGILVVGVVTMPFRSEGSDIRNRALEGVRELERDVDSMLIINNEKLYSLYGKLLVQDAFPKVDDVLSTAVKSILEIITTAGRINVDFRDVENMMRNSGMALMGKGEGTGENRIEDAVKEALTSPLLNDFDLKTARYVLINLTVGDNEDGLLMEQMDELDDTIAEYTGGHNNFKRGVVLEQDPAFGDRIKITAIATGFRLSTLLGSEGDLDNIIEIPGDFEYHNDNGPAIDSLPVRSRTGLFRQSPGRKFHFDENCPPALTATDPETLNRLEHEPAINRQRI